jgi:hypothetical protein
MRVEVRKSSGVPATERSSPVGISVPSTGVQRSQKSNLGQHVFDAFERKARTGDAVAQTSHQAPEKGAVIHVLAQDIKAQDHIQERAHKIEDAAGEHPGNV